MAPPRSAADMLNKGQLWLLRWAVVGEIPTFVPADVWSDILHLDSPFDFKIEKKAGSSRPLVWSNIHFRVGRRRWSMDQIRLALVVLPASTSEVCTVLDTDGSDVGRLLLALLDAGLVSRYVDPTGVAYWRKT